MFREVVVIGSGFGGAVMAARLGGHASVLVLEKGDDPTGSLDPRSNGARLNAQGNRFAQSMSPDDLLATKRDFVFAEGCRRIGAAAAPLKVADEGDANEGWWNQGQRFSGRQSLFLNYLADAKRTGVEMWSGCEVTRIERAKTGYVV